MPGEDAFVSAAEFLRAADWRPHDVAPNPADSPDKATKLSAAIELPTVLSATAAVEHHATSLHESSPATVTEKIAQLVTTEATMVRRSGAILSVVLRPDANTELFVQLARRDGQLEATVRCERGDTTALGAHWGQLQESLARQNVRLAPMQDAATPNFREGRNPPPSSNADTGGQPRRERAPAADSLDDLPVIGLMDEPSRQRPREPELAVAATAHGWEGWA